MYVYGWSINKNGKSKNYGFFILIFKKEKYDILQFIP